MKCIDCERTIKDHYWARVNAQEEGWFFKKDGTAYCPDHAPAWVETWRQSK
jgi:hypothetical protein